MAAAISLNTLRALARAYTEGVEGVGDELVAVARQNPDKLAKVLGIDAAVVDTVQWGELPVAGLVRIIESAPARIRALRQQDVAATAHRLADVLGQTAVFDAGSIRVSTDVLVELLGVTRGYDTVVFRTRDETRIIDCVLLRALLRECRGVVVEDLCIGPETTAVQYHSDKSRGFVRLRHLDYRASDRAVVVDVDAPAAVLVEPRPATGETPPTIPTTEQLPPLPVPVRKPFWHHILDAIATRGAP